MPVLSYLYELFNVDQCHAYIHTLRWKDRPLQCPRCQSQDIDPWGMYHYRPGCKRYWCNGCQRTFNDLTTTLLHQSKRSLAYWILATFLLCLSCSSRRIARELGVHISTTYRWCWWLRNTAVSYETDRQVEGTVEADNLYHTAARRDKPGEGAASPWVVDRVVAARSANQAETMMTKTGPPLSPGSVGKGLSSSRQRAIAPSRRCRRRPTWRYTRGVGCTPTRRAALGP
jgi:transposase-like protein